MDNRSNMGERPDDATMDLVRRLRGGDDDAVARLDSLYRDALLRYCWGYLGGMEEAEDALQDIWYKVLTAPRVPDCFRPWLYKIARNHCLNLLRHRARRKESRQTSVASQLAESLTGHLTRLAHQEMQSQLQEVVRRLPDAQQEVLRLRYVEGLSRPEIAEVLETTESVVKSRLFEGLKKLREYMKNLD